MRTKFLVIGAVSVGVISMRGIMGMGASEWRWAPEHEQGDHRERYLGLYLVDIPQGDAPQPPSSLFHARDPVRTTKTTHRMGGQRLFVARFIWL